MVSQRPRTLAEAVAIACVAEEVLAEQYGPLNKKERTRTAIQIPTPIPSLLKFQTIRTTSRMAMGKGKGMRNKVTRLTDCVIIVGGAI